MQSARIRGLPFLALSSLFFSAPEAGAADCHPANGLSTCIDVDNLWPHTGGGPYFALGSAATTPRGAFAFGLVGSFLTHPLGLHVASADLGGSDVFVVAQAFDTTLLVALGVTDRLELTLAAPETLYQRGAGLAPKVTGATLPRAALRDVRFGFSVAVLRRDAERGPALKGRLEFAAPSGSNDAFARGATAVVAPSLAFSYRIGRVDVSAEALARLRGEAVFAGAVMGPQVGGAVGASVDVLRERWLSAGAEFFALYTTSRQLPDPRDVAACAASSPDTMASASACAAAASTPPLVPAEWIAHVSTAHFLRGDLTLSLGGGSSVPFSSRSAITSPQYRLEFAIRYAPTVTKGATSPR
jgi:hypothetical protein